MLSYTRGTMYEVIDDFLFNISCNLMNIDFRQAVFFIVRPVHRGGGLDEPPFCRPIYTILCSLPVPSGARMLASFPGSPSPFSHFIACENIISEKLKERESLVWNRAHPWPPGLQCGWLCCAQLLQPLTSTQHAAYTVLCP